MSRYRTLTILSLFAAIEFGCNEVVEFNAGVGNCLSGQTIKDGRCVDIKCGPNQKIENGGCVDIECGPNQKIENGGCVDIECGPNQKIENGDCVDIGIGDEVDPCEGKNCNAGTCSEGICVTAEMRSYQNDDPCDPEAFVEFCDGNQTVYCDQGIVVKTACPSGCVVYYETYHGVEKVQSGCIDTDYNHGICSELNALERTCDDSLNSKPTVFATACQRTTRNLLRWISVDGYYCKASCDAAHQKCALAENECDPYDKSNYQCDRRNLTMCYLDSNLEASVRNVYCAEACVTIHDIAMCGYACNNPGDRQNRCVNADSMDVKDSGMFICHQVDSGALYSVWNGDYELCATGCETSTGECKP